MDPYLAKQLLDRGEITQDTYNAMVGGVGVSAAPMSSQMNTTPVLPPAGPPAPAVAPAPVDLAALQKQFTQPQTPIDLRPALAAQAAPPVDSGFATSRAPVPAAPAQNANPYAGSSEDLKMFTADGSPLPKPAAKKNAADTLLESQGKTRESSNTLLGEKQTSVTREHEAYANGLKDASSAQLAAADDSAEQLKKDEAFKAAAMARQQEVDDASRARAREIADMKVDTGRSWRQLGAPGGILLTIASALNGYSGNTNALDQMNKTVDRDINAQLAEIQNKKDGWKMEENIAAREAARDQDWLTWRAAKRAEGLGVLKLRVDSIMNDSKSTQIQEQGKQVSLGLQQEIVNNNDKYGVQVYQNMHAKEQAAAQAAAAQSAQHAAQLGKVQALTEKLVLGDANNAPMAPEQARLVAQQTIFGANAGGGTPLPTVGSRTSKEQAKDIGERLVVVDGKEQLATSKEAATNYREFATIQPEAKRLVAQMKAALASSDPAKYEAARGKLIEVMPPIYGYKRGPSNTQAEHTFGPEVIPEYPHWYNAGAESWGTAMSRNDKMPLNTRVLDKLDDIDKTIDTVGSSLRQQTFGAGPGGKTETPSKEDPTKGFTGVK